MSILISFEHWPVDLPRLERFCEGGEMSDADMPVRAGGKWTGEIRESA